MKFWIQSFLLGVPKIIVGFRTADGTLVRLEEFDTQKIPDLVKSRGRNLWDGNTCINFTANFLECMCLQLLGSAMLMGVQGSSPSLPRTASGGYESEKKCPSLKSTSLKNLAMATSCPRILCDGAPLNFRACLKRKLQRRNYQCPVTHTLMGPLIHNELHHHWADKLRTLQSRSARTQDLDRDGNGA